MPVLGSRPLVSPNSRGQMTSSGSTFNPRGIGSPRPPTSVMPTAQAQAKPALANSANAKPKPKKRPGAQVVPKGKFQGMNRREVKRYRSLRDRYLANDRRDKVGNRRITGGEKRTLQRKLREFKNNPASIPEYLAGDLTYKSQVSDLRRNKRNYLTDFRSNMEDVNETFADTLAKMEREKGRQLESISEDFGGRGLVFSGLHAKARDEYSSEFGHRVNELSDDMTEQKQDLRRNRQLFLEELRSIRRNARDEAIRRRAARFGL